MNKIIVFIRIFILLGSLVVGCSASEWAVPLLYENLSEKLALISFDLYHRRNRERCAEGKLLSPFDMS